MDYYQILGISKDAPQEEIKKAYRKLAHRYHPDKGGDEKKFKEINEAYQILSDQQKRSQYDRFGQVFEGGAGSESGSGFSWAWGRPGRADRSGGSNFEDIFSGSNFGDLGEIMEEMFGFGGPRKRKDIRKGKDIEINFEISLEDVLKGKKEEISLHKQIICSRCQGTGAEPGTSINECFSCRGMGQVQQIKKTLFGSFTRHIICPECNGEGQRPERACNVCKGEGRVKGEDHIKIFIPVGVDANQVIKIEKRGEAGRRNGRTGDLYIRISIKRHPIFKRRGDDLYISLFISFSQVALGDEIEVPTLGGDKILLKIPSGIESGKVLRISGKGIPHFSSLGRGNIYVELIIKTPKKLTKKQKELFEQLKKEDL